MSIISSGSARTPRAHGGIRRVRIMAVGFDACGSWQHDQILTIDESVPFSVTHLSIVYGTVSARFFLQPAVACRFTDHAAAASALRYGIVSIENVPALCRSSKTVGTGTTARGRCGQSTGATRPLARQRRGGASNQAAGAGGVLGRQGRARVRGRLTGCPRGWWRRRR